MANHREFDSSSPGNAELDIGSLTIDPSGVSQPTRDTSDDPRRLQELSSRPWWPPILLVLAVLSVSSAGAVMKSVTAAAPVALSTWRLQATSIVLAPGFAAQLWLSQSDTRSRIASLSVIATLFISAVALAAHFGLWVYSLSATSLPHSLLFVSTPPLILATYSLATGTPMKKGEITGLVLGIIGVILIAASAASEQEVTFLGDVAAFGAAVAFSLYVTVAKDLRLWMPLYLFAFPVTATSALLLALVSGIQGALVAGHANSTIQAHQNLLARSSSEAGSVYISFNSDVPPHSVYNPLIWVSLPYLLPVAYLALGPGFVGHTGLNAVLRYMSPLTISMAITSEPPLGSLLGWAMGETGVPGPLTWIGGVLLIVATVWVACSDDSEDGEEKVPLNRREEIDECKKLDFSLKRDYDALQNT